MLECSWIFHKSKNAKTHSKKISKNVVCRHTQKHDSVKMPQQTNEYKAEVVYVIFWRFELVNECLLKMSIYVLKLLRG